MISLFLVLILSGPAPAHAECSHIVGGIKRKISEFNAYRKANQLAMDKLLNTETSCRDKGATISSSIAKLAEGLSCEAQMDANQMDKKLTKIGEDCEALFKKIHEMQNDLHIKFAVVQGDLNDGMGVMRNSPDLQKDCAKEMKVTQDMVKSFSELESKIQWVEVRSLDGKVNYGKFKDTAKSLSSLTLSRGTGCKDLTNAVSKAVQGAGKNAQGSGAVVPTGTSPKTSSDITGTKPPGATKK